MCHPLNMRQVGRKAPNMPFYLTPSLCALSALGPAQVNGCVRRQQKE
jgi:hypothetical protein